jgi:hypothetical protein
MDENASGRGSVFETNDSLEAVSVFRAWKNIFFMILLACLLVTQAAFWLINLKIVEVPGVAATAPNAPTAIATPAGPTATPAAETETATAGGGFLQKVLANLTFERVARTVDLVNGILIVAAVLLAASVFFALMVSLVGRLGGLNHISRAFVLSMIAVVLLVPWQLLGLNVLGVTWTPEELVGWLPSKDASLSNTIIFYLRFTAYWAAIALLLLLAQARSTRWSKSILRRLEII